MRPVLVALVLCLAVSQGFGQAEESPSRLRGVIERFEQDSGALNRFYSATTSPNRAVRMKALNGEYLAELSRLNFDSLNHDEQVDYILFRNYLDHEQKELVRFDAQLAEHVERGVDDSAARDLHLE